jgi:uncharacterized membrane protein
MPLESLEKIRARSYNMNINDWIHVFAGTFIIISLVLGIWASPYWFLFTAFVGVNLFQYGLTKFCPMGMVLKKMGVPEERI